MKKSLLFLLGAFGLPILLFAQPANDACPDAVEVMIDETVSFTTLDATTDGPLHLDSPCPSAGSDSIFHDVWYRFTAPLTGEVVWSLCGTADFDTKIAVYVPSAQCPPTDEDLLDCNEDSGSCANATSELIFDVEEGMTYTLRIGGFGEMDGGGGETGSGTFTIQEFVFDGPANSFCEDAFEAGLGTTEFTTIGAITDGPDHPNNPCFGFGSLNAGRDVWYTYTPDFTGAVEWSTCSSASFDTRLAVYNPGSPCPPADEDLYACNDDGAGCEGFTSSLFFEVEAGMTYLLRLGGFNDDNGTGTFDLTEIVPPEPPVNDQCMDATEIALLSREAADNFDIIYEGTTEFGSAVYDQPDNEYLYPTCLANQNGGEFSDVWFRMQSLGNSEIELRLNAVEAGTIFFADVFTACGERLDSTLNTCLNTTEELGFVMDTITGLPEEDLTLYLRVITRLTSDAPGQFWVQPVADIISSTDQPLELQSFRMFPNPANEVVHVQFGLPEPMMLRGNLLNALGQCVRTWQTAKLGSGLHQLSVNVADLTPGIYFLQYTAEGRQFSRRLVVE